MENTAEDKLEEIILHESIVSAAGLNSEQVLIDLRGAPSIWHMTK